MACHLFGAKQLYEPTMIYCQLDPKEHIIKKYYLKFYKVFIPRKWENSFENIVYEIAAIFFSSSMCLKHTEQWCKDNVV